LSVKFTQSLFLEMENYWDVLNLRNIEIDMSEYDKIFRRGYFLDNNELPIDEELVPDILTMMLTFNTERDKSKDISIDEPFEPMSNVNICDNLSEIVVGAIDTWDGMKLCPGRNLAMAELKTNIQIIVKKPY
ncbi:6595_t:CDS:2, partial [Funneliformis geosporum]